MNINNVLSPFVNSFTNIIYELWAMFVIPRFSCWIQINALIFLYLHEITRVTYEVTMFWNIVLEADMTKFRKY